MQCHFDGCHQRVLLILQGVISVSCGRYISIFTKKYHERLKIDFGDWRQ
jgi:hypothetical protein